VESEEFAHVERRAEESRQAREKQSQAFLLMLKARRSWPERFAIKCYELSPAMWQHKIEAWILRQAAIRLVGDSKGLGFMNSRDSGTSLKILRGIVADIWKIQGRSFFRSTWFGGLGHFIIVTAHVHEDVATSCLKNLEEALGRSKAIEPDLIWREFDMELPIPHEPTLWVLACKRARAKRIASSEVQWFCCETGTWKVKRSHWNLRSGQHGPLHGMSVPSYGLCRRLLLLERLAATPKMSAPIVKKPSVEGSGTGEMENAEEATGLLSRDKSVRSEISSPPEIVVLDNSV
jgi:hypothetical protein